MTDPRQRRVDTLRQAARRKSEAKAKAAETAIRALVKRGEPITFQSVQREAGVSHAFLYANADLRARIERLRDQARPKPSPPDGAGCDNTIIQALTSRYPRGAGDLPDPLLPSAVQVERGLQQPPLQLAAVGPDHLLPLPVVQEPRLVRRPGQQPGELLGRAGAYR